MTSQRRIWDEVFETESAPETREIPKPYSTKPDGTDDAGHKDEND